MKPTEPSADSSTSGTRPGGSGGLTPAASVVVITRNRCASLQRTLEALARLEHPSFEVIVVDNASTDETREVVGRSSARYVFSPASRGISGTRQLGVEASRGPVIAMCDDDCEPEPDWLTRLEQRLAREDDLALVGGRVINIGFPGMQKFKGTTTLGGPNGRLAFVEDAADARYFGNLNLALRRAAVERVGGYDPFLKAGLEEIDLADSLRRLGYRTGFEESAVVRHHFTGINYKRGRLVYGGHLMRLYFYLKHFPPRGGRAWLRFLRDEAGLLARDAWRAGRLTAAAVLRGRFRRLPGLAVEWLNLVSARLLLPWVHAKARSASRRLDRRDAGGSALRGA